MKIARTTRELKTGLKDESLHSMYFPNTNNMTMKGMKDPVQYYGITNGKVTDSGIAYPGEDFKVNGQSTLEYRLKNRNMNNPFYNKLPVMQDGGNTNKPKGGRRANSLIAKLVGKDKPFKDVKSLQQALNELSSGEEVTALKTDNVAGPNTLKALQAAVSEGAFYKELGNSFNFDKVPKQFQDNPFILGGKQANALANVENMLDYYQSTLRALDNDLPQYLKDNVGEGKKFKDVKELQANLNQSANALSEAGMLQGYTPLKVDGVFGNKSKGAVKSMKNAVGAASAALDTEAENVLGMDMEDYRSTQPNSLAEAITNPIARFTEENGKAMAQGQEDQNSVRNRLTELLMDKLQADSPEAVAELLSNVDLSLDPNDPNANLGQAVDANIGSSVGIKVKEAVEQLKSEIGTDANDPYFSSVIESSLGDLGTDPQNLQALSGTLQSQIQNPKNIPGAPTVDNDIPQPYVNPEEEVVPNSQPPISTNNAGTPQNPTGNIPNVRIAQPVGPNSAPSINGLVPQDYNVNTERGDAGNATTTPSVETPEVTPEAEAEAGTQAADDAANAAAAEAENNGEDPEKQQVVKNGNRFEVYRTDNGSYALRPVGTTTEGSGQSAGYMATGKNTGGQPQAGNNRRNSAETFRPILTNGPEWLRNPINDWRMKRKSRRVARRERREHQRDLRQQTAQENYQAALAAARGEEYKKVGGDRRNYSDARLNSREAGNQYQLGKQEQDNKFDLYDRSNRHLMDQSDNNRREIADARSIAHAMDRQDADNRAQILANEKNIKLAEQRAYITGQGQARMERSMPAALNSNLNLRDEATKAQLRGYGRAGYRDSDAKPDNLPAGTRPKYSLGGYSLPKRRGV